MFCAATNPNQSLIRPDSGRAYFLGEVPDAIYGDLCRGSLGLLCPYLCVAALGPTHLAHSRLERIFLSLHRAGPACPCLYLEISGSTFLRLLPGNL